MNIKKNKIISVIGIFLISFLIHGAYEIFPNPIFSIFFPVNESIFEHMKMLFTNIMIFVPIEYLILKKFDIKHNNLTFSYVIGALASIPAFLLMFLPIYYRIGENMPITIFLMLIAIIISQIISMAIMKCDYIKYNGILAIVLIILTYSITTYLTYNPMHNDFFYDGLNETYGIKK